MFDAKGLIVLEGSDCTGKTTLAENLTKLFHNAIIVHHTYYEVGQYSVLKHSLVNAIEWISQGQLVIFDRFDMSETIYGQVYRDGSCFTNEETIEMLKLLRSVQTLQIICTPDNVETIVDTHKNMKEQRYEMYDDIRQVAEIYLKVAQKWRKEKIPDKIVYDWTKNNKSNSEIIKVAGLITQELGINYVSSK